MIVFAVPLADGGRRACGGPGATRHAAFLAAGTSRCSLHAMVDWDWEMPALFIWFFGAAGAVARRAGGGAPSTRASRGG